MIRFRIAGITRWKGDESRKKLGDPVVVHIMPSGIMGPRLFLRRDGNMLLPFPWFSGVRSGGRDTFIEVQDEIETSLPHP